jgi:outer membrane immunogenic protein
MVRGFWITPQQNCRAKQFFCMLFGGGDLYPHRQKNGPGRIHRGSLMKRILVPGIAAAAFCGAPATAADMPVKAPVYKAAAAPLFNWTGFYVGANAGLGTAHTRANSPDGTISDSFAVGFVDTYSGFTGGFQVGYNWQFAPNWVFGVEGDVGYLGTRRSALDAIQPGLQTTVKSDFYSTIRARLGYAWDRSLLYATGGVAFVRLKDSFDCCGFPVDFDHTESSITKTGWTVGGGIETALAANWTAKVEYLFIDAGKVNVAETGDVPAQNSDTMQYRHQFHVIKFGLNYRFGAGPVVARY